MFRNRKPDEPKAPPAENVRGLRGLTEARELFWQNVIREMLTSLSVLGASKSTPRDANVPGQSPPSTQQLFDGRLAVITNLGQRIPIAAVTPLFACGIPTSENDKALSMAVECSVFQIHTPGGEVFTLPLHEIRSFHSLSEDLIEQLNQAATSNGNGQSEPFGFAAYTSLARSKFPAEALSPTLPSITGPGLEGDQSRA